MIDLSIQELHNTALCLIDNIESYDQVNELQKQIVFKLSQINPTLFSHINTQNFYHLTQMERKYVEEGKFAYEAIEPGYYQGVLKGWSVMLESVLSEEEVTPDLILKLHDHCVDGLITEDYPYGVPKGFRTFQDGGEAFYLEKGQTVSKEGFEELLDSYKNQQYVDEVGDIVYLYKGVMFHPESTIQLDPNQGQCRRLSEKYKFKLMNNRELNFVDEMNTLAETNIDPREQISSPMIKLKPVRTVFLRIVIQKLIDQFNTSSKSLEDIVRLIQSLDQVHPFVDGNIRTFGILLLNMLLITHAELPCVMDDVNRFDCLSTNELVNYIREGQSYFQNIS